MFPYKGKFLNWSEKQQSTSQEVFWRFREKRQYTWFVHAFHDKTSITVYGTFRLFM
jgi:hypothetical protein